MRPASEHLAQLKERLSVMREGLTGEALAGLLGWSASKVSRVFSGTQIPSVPDLRHVAERLGHPEVADELVELRQQAEVNIKWRRQLAEGGETDLQQSYDELFRSAALIRSAQVSVIPGILQTPGYIRGIFTQIQAINPEAEIDIDAAVDARWQRQGILHEEGRAFEFVIGYGALVTPPCPPDAMFTQLDRLLWSMDLGNVTLGIFPEGQQVAISFYNGFELLDDLLLVENYGYEDQVTGEQAALHARIFAMLMKQSAKQDDARGLIAAAAATLRGGK